VWHERVSGRKELREMAPQEGSFFFGFILFFFLGRSLTCCYFPTLAGGIETFAEPVCIRSTQLWVRGACGDL